MFNEGIGPLGRAIFMGGKSDTLYVSDLDGTLLIDDGVLSSYTKEKLISILESGVNFTVASARSIVSVQQILRGFPFRLPVIGINGAFISDFVTGKHLVINDMSDALIEDVYSYILRYNCVPFISTFDGNEDRLYYHSLPNDGMQWYYDNRRLAGDRRLCQVDRLRDVFVDDIVAFTVINTRQQLINLAKKMMDDFSDRLQMHFFENPYSPPWHWLTIHDKKACKSEAVRELLSYTGFALKDLVVFGDNLNDVNMFKMCPKSIAVSNASDQIKKLATEVIGANTDDSVVKYVMEAEGVV